MTPDQFRRPNPAMKQASRRLRKQQTTAERRLWYFLRKRQFEGLHFRRQHPIGRYIVDFYCAEHRLIVEVDGESHNHRVEYDEVRTDWLESQGYRVVRFTNEQVRRNVEGVLTALKDVIGELQRGSCSNLSE